MSNNERALKSVAGSPSSPAGVQALPSTTYRAIRELGKRSQRTFVAVRSGNASAKALFVVNRFGEHENDATSPDQIAVLLRDAECLQMHWHPNVARVRHVDLVESKNTLYIATDLIDGITLTDLVELRASASPMRTGPVLPAPILARIFLDVFSGLSAFHSLREGIATPLSIFHGELCPTNVVIGRDGVARIVNVFRPRPVTITSNSEALRYAAPEMLAADEAHEDVEQDVRVDIYAVGVMLWEALMGRPLYGRDDSTSKLKSDSPTRLAQRQREEDVPRPPGPLGEVAMRALAFDPVLRFRTAQDAAATLRAFARTALATGSVVAQTITDLAGDRIRSRRAALELGVMGRVSSGQRPAVQMPASASSIPPSYDVSASDTRATAPPPPVSFSPPSSPPPSSSRAPRSQSRPTIPPLSFRPLLIASPPSSSRKLPPPLPRTDADDADLMGPRGSNPNVGYVPAAIHADDLIADDGDQHDTALDVDSHAISASRQVVVSKKSMTPIPPPMTSETPSPPSPFPAFPVVDRQSRSQTWGIGGEAVDQLTSSLSFPKSTPVLSTASPSSSKPRLPPPLPPPIARPATPTPAAAPPMSIRTPPVVMLPGLARANMASHNARQRLLPIIFGIAVGALLLLLAGAAVIARSSRWFGTSSSTPTTTTTTTTTIDPPSTVIVAPAPAAPATTTN